MATTQAIPVRLVFCSDPSNPRAPEPAFEREVDAALKLGIEFDLIDHDALVAGRREEIAPRLRTLATEALAVFRGWMMKPAQYQQLHDLLLERGRRLINTPEQYRHCHHLPESYAVIAEHSPRSVWSKGVPSTDELMRLLAPFGDRALVVKDFVKSQKHAWAEACFIPNASDRQHVERVVRRFAELQGADLNEGLVFREFVELERVGVHPKSGMPLSREFRQFFVDGQPALSFKYWDEADYSGEFAPPEWLRSVAARIRSRFFSMDLARQANGEWLIVEVGDGQVTGLPEAADPLSLFASLRDATVTSPGEEFPTRR